MSEFFEGDSDGASIFGVDIARTGFGLLSGGHDGVDDFAVYLNGSVEARWRIIGTNWKLGFVGQIEVASTAGPGFGLSEI